MPRPQTSSSVGSPEKLAGQSFAAPVTSFCPSLKLTGATAAEREAFLQVVPWAEALGAKWLRVFDARAGGTEAELAEAVETVRWWRGAPPAPHPCVHDR